MQIEKTTPAVWYCITCTAPVTVSAELNGLPVILVSLDQEGQTTFCAPTREVTVETDGTYSVLPTEAPGGQPFGGYVNRNLTIGHGAADAVKAVCTLTLRDLATGGSLTDSNRQSVELAAPHAYAEGYLEFRDATEACTLSIGEWSMTWEEKTDAKASGTFYIMPDEETISVTNGEEEYPVQVPNDPTSVAGWNQSFTAAGCGIVCTATDPHGEIDVSVEAAEVGEDGNGIEIAVGSCEPVTLAGGSTARTKQDVVDALNGGADCPVHASLDADEEAISLTAKVYGVNDAISATGDMFSNWSGMSGGHGDYTVAELATAIEGGFSDITPTAGEVEDSIILTSNTPGAAANAITYTATGCFGSGTVKQGSTTRGKNAVAQTDFEIILNGNQPRPLTPATAMKNGGVYTVAADIDARTVTLGEHATSTIVVSAADGPIPNIQFPAWKWCTDDGLLSALDYFRVYRMEVTDDGFYTSARLVSQYATASEWIYKAMTKQAYVAGNDINFVQAETSSFQNNVGFALFDRKGGSAYFKADGKALDGSELVFSLARDNKTFNYVATIELSSEKKFKAVTLSLSRQYGGVTSLYFQAWNAETEQWVDASDIVQNKKDETTYMVVPVYDSTPRSNKWRVVCEEMRSRPGAIRFFEA